MCCVEVAAIKHSYGIVTRTQGSEELDESHLIVDLWNLLVYGCWGGLNFQTLRSGREAIFKLRIVKLVFDIPPEKPKDRAIEDHTIRLLRWAT